MDQIIRNKLRSVVTQCRKLLEDAVAQTLQGQFGIYSGNKGEVHVEDAARMTHLSAEDQVYRKDILDHFDHIKARGYKPKDALDHLIREIAFTHLNRLCAYKLMEVRQVWIGGGRFREAVSRGQKSQGFLFYLADHPEDEHRLRTGQQDVAYRHFLDWLGSTLSEEIGVLFNPNDPANRLYPPQRVLDDVLALINDKELAGIWSEDETIGWVYQYFTPKELRDQARKESSAPRNSYELAFRNQFFTPRYVVEFLTDNTLGRIWYEMRRGDTQLTDQCQYMVRRPNEHFLEKGQTALQDGEESTNDLSQEELLKQPVYISYRPKKDPRDLKILDPACGSGHFLLYCFDLILTIYEEAYNDPDLGPVLRKDYSTLEDLQRAVPGLILSHNLHGIDIDIRATQIAAFALWLRCQRAYQEMGLKRDHPKITRSNIVCAEPMPGEKYMLKEFVAELQPRVLGQLVEVVFDKMKLAGEAGSLLKIEEDIAGALAEAKKQWLSRPQTEQLTLWSEEKRLKAEQLGLFDISDITDEEFWLEAEARVFDALHEYARHATDGLRLQRQLFAEDATHGFAFVDLCRQRFDVVLMNPPYGDAPEQIKPHLDSYIRDWNHNLLCAFISRTLGLLDAHGSIGVLYDRTANIKNIYESFRYRYFLGGSPLTFIADLGWNVLDANVEVAAGVLSRTRYASTFQSDILWGTNLIHIPIVDKAETLLAATSEKFLELSHTVSIKSLTHLPNAVVGYFFPEFVLRIFDEYESLEHHGVRVIQGHTIKSDEFFRYFWELPTVKDEGLSGTWARIYNGGSYSRYLLPLVDTVMYGNKGSAIANHRSTIFRNLNLQQQPGLAFGKRGDFIDAHYLRDGFVSTVEGQACVLDDLSKAFKILAVLNSRLFQYVINQYCGQHKYAGYVNLFPIPNLSHEDMRNAGEICERIVEMKEYASTWDETSPLFVSFGGNPRETTILGMVEHGQQLQQKIRRM